MPELTLAAGLCTFLQVGRREHSQTLCPIPASQQKILTVSSMRNSLIEPCVGGDTHLHNDLL